MHRAIVRHGGQHRRIGPGGDEDGRARVQEQVRRGVAGVCDMVWRGLPDDR